MVMKYNVVALGELLIDFTQNGISAQGNNLFEANPGGAPCNVLAMLSKLNRKTAFIGRVGNDAFGDMLRSTIIQAGIDDTALICDNAVNTTLAFVTTAQDGERSFSFYRNPGADMMLSKDDVPVRLLENTDIFHFGTLSMTHQGVREATRFAIDAARVGGALLSFDPNLRPPLWDSMGNAIEQMKYGCSVCDILKIEDGELKTLTGCKETDEGVKMLFEKYGISLILVTFGKNGSAAYCGNIKVERPTFLNVKTIDTTGAGDTFMGCCLHFLLGKDILNMTKNEFSQMLTFANAAASLVTTKKGALRSMPSLNEIEELIFSK